MENDELKHMKCKMKKISIDGQRANSVIICLKSIASIFRPHDTEKKTTIIMEIINVEYSTIPRNIT